MKKASELGSALGDLHGFHGFSAQTILLTKGTHCHIAKTMIDSKSTYDFSSEKNQLLINEKGVSFEEIIAAIDDNRLLDVLAHPNATKYANQKVYVVDINGYVYLVPFVRQSKDRVFLKTIFPSRKLTKIYLRNRKVLHDQQ